MKQTLQLFALGLCSHFAFTQAAKCTAENTTTPIVISDPEPDAPIGMYVKGRYLYDRCGEEVILRGVNEMTVWSPTQDSLPSADEIYKTNANVIRIVWNSNDGSASKLDTAIQNVYDREMIPMIENHDATGNLTLLEEVVDWWISDEILAVIAKHEKYLMVNIANESGDNDVTPEQFLTAYQLAVTRMRNAGIRTILVIDAPGWGQDIDTLQATGFDLLAHDPLSNLLFSVHMWWDDPEGVRVKTELQESVDMKLPLIVGEFAQHAVYLCDEAPFDYEMLLVESHYHGIGWLAWSWGAVVNGDCADEGSFDMTVDGVYGDWKEDWGADVAYDHEYGITITSYRPYSMVHGECKV